MILISKTQREKLDRLGLIRYKKTGPNAQEANLVITNKCHKSRDKTYYIAEDYEILTALEKYETLNLQKIYPNQLADLKKKNLITEDQIQYPNEYKKDAICFVAKDGTIRLKKIATLMLATGIWHQKNKQTN